MLRDPKYFMKKFLKEKEYLKSILKDEGLLLGKRNNFLEEEELIQILLNSYRPILEEEIENFLQKNYPTMS